jgi:hypothetical protein
MNNKFLDKLKFLERNPNGLKTINKLIKNNAVDTEQVAKYQYKTEKKIQKLIEGGVKEIDARNKFDPILS